LNAEEIQALSKRVKEPEFLARRRAAAWAHCEKTPFPPRTEELWRRTDISSLKWDAILATREPHVPVAEAGELPASLRLEIGPREERSALLVQLDSSTVLIERDKELEKLGVIVMPVLEAV